MTVLSPPHAGDAIIPLRVWPSITIPNGAAAGDYEGVLFIATEAFELISVSERHLVAGSDAGAVTAMLKKVPSGTAPAGGTDMLASGLNLKAAANTVQKGTLHGTVANRRLAAGDSIAIVTTGTLTAVDGPAFTLELKRIV